MSVSQSIKPTDTNCNEINVDIQTDSINERSPTAEELVTLKHISDKIPTAAWLIIVCEFCERFAFIGLTGPFQNYIQFPVPGPGDKQPGALGRGHQMATLLTTTLQFLCYLTPIFGATLADQYFGKYKTIFCACITYIFGLLVLVLSSTPVSIRLGLAFPGLIVSIVILGFSTGGVKSNVSPLMAEQYTRKEPIVREINGEKKIIDPKITLQSMFNWFYWAINLGALSTVVTTNTEKYHSYWLAFTLPMLVFMGAIVTLIIGRHRFIQKPPNGSFVLRAFRVTLAAIRIRWRQGRQDCYQHWLDYAKDKPSQMAHHADTENIITPNNHQFIDDLKQAFRACRVFAFYPFYWVCANQLTGNMISQAAQMNVGPLPNDLLQNIDPLALLFLIPIFDITIYPALRQLKIRFSAIPRITCGFLCVSIAMGWTAFVQHLIYSTGPNYDYAIKPSAGQQAYNNITVAWQIPSYVIIAISEIFAAVTGLEYAFTQAPSSMKSVVVSLFLFTSAIGNALNFALLPVIRDPKLLWMYTSLSIVAFVVGIIFYLCFRNEHENHHEEQIDR